ncbi:MAG: hypothetical protein O3A49_03490 [Candidatus Marinimicrobia bacterium]|nr:hypothetical protein [Candidatus Neomarinimicrobiota bacterium]MDA1363761.1 hypothetical protein [Candidatus Neomarinimicrobiota bacterium]
MEYTTKSVLLTKEHFQLVTKYGMYTHEIFTNFKNTKFGKIFNSQPFPGQYLLFIAGGLAESYHNLHKDIFALTEFNSIKFSKPACVGDGVYLYAKQTRATKNYYYFKWYLYNHNNEKILSCGVKFIRNNDE